MCREEVRLNRRLAPEVYLGVRSVAAGADGLELAAEDDPRAVDYVVEMRRYDERSTLAARLERGELKRGEVVTAARGLAAFHAHARRVPARGVPVLGIERRMTENFHELLAIVEQRAEVEWVLALERFAHAFVVGHAQLLDERARRGLVRELHGDLRAEHVLLGRKVEIVDCIEFDRGLRELDVADELAFLAMDLTASGGERFARTLVDAYRDAGGDPGEDWLIAFYASYRALVRGKVALLRAAQHPAASSARAHESATARELLGLAERFAWRARLPLVIAICGVPAAGKSHLAQALAGVSRTCAHQLGSDPQAACGNLVASTGRGRCVQRRVQPAHLRRAGPPRGRRDGRAGRRPRRCHVSPPRRPGCLCGGVRRPRAGAVRRVPGTRARPRTASGAA